jgi:hypothetical protein
MIGYCKYWKGQGYDCDWCNHGCTVSGSCSSERCNVSNVSILLLTQKMKMENEMKRRVYMLYVYEGS